MSNYLKASFTLVGVLVLFLSLYGCNQETGSIQVSGSEYSVSSGQSFFSGNDTSTTYSIRDSQGNPINATENHVTISVDIPTNPDAQLGSVEVSIPEEGELEVDYNFTQSGKYRALMVIHKNGVIADMVSFTMDVIK